MVIQAWVREAPEWPQASNIESGVPRKPWRATLVRPPTEKLFLPYVRSRLQYRCINFLFLFMASLRLSGTSYCLSVPTYAQRSPRAIAGLPVVGILLRRPPADARRRLRIGSSPKIFRYPAQIAYQPTYLSRTSQRSLSVQGSSHIYDLAERGRGAGDS